MSTSTSIEWTDATWNPVRGCSRVSPGCQHCYAELVAARFSGPGQAYEGFAKLRSNGEPAWTGKVALVEKHLADPLRWKEPRRIFVNSMSDLFHEDLPDEVIAAVFAVMALAPQHTFQVLTKRPARMFEWFKTATGAWPEIMGVVNAQREPIDSNVAHHLGASVAGRDRTYSKALTRVEDTNAEPWPLPNVWLGVSAEDQERADERIPLLLQTPAAVRFVSAEPLLGPIDFTKIRKQLTGAVITLSALHATDSLNIGQAQPKLDWIIVGGESGPGARPCDVAWIRAIRDQCEMADVACFVKQLGAAPFEFCPPERGGPTDITSQDALADLGPDAVRTRSRLAPGPDWTFTTMPAGERGTGWYKHYRLRDRKGGAWSEWPENLRVREFPTVPA